MNRRMRATVLAGLLLLSGGPLACGSDGGRDISEAASTDLQARIDQLRSTAAAGDREGADAQLAALRDQVGRYHSEAALGDDEARRILAAADVVAEELAVIPTTTTTTTAPPPPTDDGEDDDAGSDRGNGKDKHPGKGRKGEG